MKKNTNTLPNTITYNSVIDCCLKCGDYDSADKFFNEMLGIQNISPDIITSSSSLIESSVSIVLINLGVID